MDGGFQYEKFLSFFNSQGIVVYQTADNISYVVVEGRSGQKNRRLACGAADDNGVPVVSAIDLLQWVWSYVTLLHAAMLVYMCT